MLDTKSKYLFAIFLVLIVLTAGASYWRIVVNHDYEVVQTVDEEI